MKIRAREEEKTEEKLKKIEFENFSTFKFEYRLNNYTTNHLTFQPPIDSKTIERGTKMTFSN